MTDNFTTVRQDIKEVSTKVHSLDLRLGTLEVEIKHMRDDFKWIRIVLVAGVSLGVVLGLLFASIGGVLK